MIHTDIEETYSVEETAHTVSNTGTITLTQQAIESLVPEETHAILPISEHATLEVQVNWYDVAGIKSEKELLGARIVPTELVIQRTTAETGEEEVGIRVFAITQENYLALEELRRIIEQHPLNCIEDTAITQVIWCGIGMCIISSLPANSDLEPLKHFEFINRHEITVPGLGTVDLSNLRGSTVQENATYIVEFIRGNLANTKRSVTLQQVLL